MPPLTHNLISGAFTARTTGNHVNLLRDFEEFALQHIAKYGQSPQFATLEEGYLRTTPRLIERYLVERRNNPRAPTKTGDPHCKWSHIQGIHGSLLGALRDAPLHGSRLTLLDEADMISKIDRTLSKKANVEPVLFPKPTTHAHVLQAQKLLRSLPQPLGSLASLYLDLWESTAARPMDALLLLPNNVKTLRTVHDRKVWSITFVEGKGVLIRGPYTVHTVLTDDTFLQMALKHPNSPSLFPLELRALIQKEVMNALKTTDQKYEQRSIRRGSLQVLAMAGADEPTLLSFSGHKHAPMLWRYLGWGMMRGKAQVAGAEAAIAAWHA